MDTSSPLINTIIFYTRSGDDALAVIRVIGPAKEMGLRVIRGIVDSKVHVEYVRDGDLIILQRDFCLDLESYEQVLALARELHKPVIFDLDDLLFELPEYHPDRLRFHFADALLPMLQAVMEVDLVTVSTPALRDYLLPFNQNIAVIPNYLNDKLWSFKPPTLSDAGDDKVIIGYMGGPSHYPDLLLILPALLRIVERYPQKVEYQFWGIEPPDELAPYSKVDWHPPVSLYYADFVSYFLTQTADIMLAPLVDSLFNSCKSSIKYLEYGAVGSSGVYSRIRPYSDIILDGQDGFLASSMEEWENCLAQLIESRELRFEIAQNAQQKIKQNWLLSQNAYSQYEIYASAVANYSPKTHSYPSFYEPLKSLSHQVTEALQHKAHQIESLKDQLSSSSGAIESLTDQLAESDRRNLLLKKQVEEREEEVLSYVLSNSWRLTRPLRALFRMLRRQGM